MMNLNGNRIWIYSETFNFFSKFPPLCPGNGNIVFSVSGSKWRRVLKCNLLLLELREKTVLFISCSCGINYCWFQVFLCFCKIKTNIWGNSSLTVVLHKHLKRGGGVYNEMNYLTSLEVYPKEWEKVFILSTLELYTKICIWRAEY